MPEAEYLPIPAHVYTLACALVTTRREEESPVVIRVEVLPCGDSDSALVSSVVEATIYPVTFSAMYATAEGKFTGWQCLHKVALT